MSKKNMQLKFDTYKHVATLSSALIVVIASFASKSAVPVEGFGPVAHGAVGEAILDLGDGIRRCVVQGP